MKQYTMAYGQKVSSWDPLNDIEVIVHSINQVDSKLSLAKMLADEINEVNKNAWNLLISVNRNSSNDSLVGAHH